MLITIKPIGRPILGRHTIKTFTFKKYIVNIIDVCEIGAFRYLWVFRGSKPLRLQGLRRKTDCNYRSFYRDSRGHWYNMRNPYPCERPCGPVYGIGGVGAG